MLLRDNSLNDENLMNLKELDYTERLFEIAKTFNYDQLNLDLLKKEVEENDKFSNNLIEFLCKLIGYDFEELVYNINYSRIESDKPSIQKMIEKQDKRVRTLIIDFFYELLPFNYLIKISRMRGKYDLKKDIREDIIRLLNSEIEKINNFNDTVDTIYQTIDARAQKENFTNISKKLLKRGNNVITENKFLIGLVDELPQNKLEELIDIYVSDKIVWKNLAD